MKLLKRYFASTILIIFIFYYISPVICYAGKLEIADGHFYNYQYEKAISNYIDALNSDSYDKIVKTNIKYKIGLSYFILGDKEKALKFWNDSKLENPGIFDGKIFRIPVGSMEPQLMKGDLIIIDNEYYKHKEINRGDVVVFLNPQDLKKLFIKRVIGMPGDKIEIKKKEIFINNSKLLDKFAYFKNSNYNSQRDDLGSFQIPNKSYFLLGDNRDESYDSRFFGTVMRDLFVGKALVIYGNAQNDYSLEGASLDRTGKIIK